MSRDGTAAHPGPICITGMHRAGTSLTARLLNVLGVDLGPEHELMPPNEASNPAGFWEHAELTDVSDSILRALGGSWREPPPLAGRWYERRAVRPARERAERVLSQRFSCGQLWGWKDPRSALTLPFWQQLVPGLRYVICVRNPRDVASSLARRDKLAVAHSYRLWMWHMAAAIVNTSGNSRIIVAYEDYFDALKATVKRLDGFLGPDGRATDQRARRNVSNIFKAGLQHHHTEPEELIADRRAPLELRALYAALMLASRLNAAELSASPPLDSFARAALRHVLELARAAQAPGNAEKTRPRRPRAARPRTK